MRSANVLSCRGCRSEPACVSIDALTELSRPACGENFRLADPVLTLDATLELEPLVVVRDIVFSPAGDLVVRVDLECVELLLDEDADAANPLEIVRPSAPTRCWPITNDGVDVPRRDVPRHAGRELDETGLWWLPIAEGSRNGATREFSILLYRHGDTPFCCRSRGANRQTVHIKMHFVKYRQKSYTESLP